MQAKVFTAMDISTAKSVLKETNRIMAELGVAYFLRHGTCLGAVRDGAFIPWDDDLDVGSVLGLHGLTEEKVDRTVDVFRENGFTATIVHNELNISVSMQKSGTQMDWTCYRIFGDVIYQWPVVKIPVALHEELKEIDFLGEKFFVPNPPEEYLLLKYGPEWMVPKQAGGFEQDVMDLMPEGSLPANSGRIMSVLNRFLPKRYTGSLLVLDREGRSVVDAQVGIGPPVCSPVWSDHRLTKMELRDSACQITPSTCYRFASESTKSFSTWRSCSRASTTSTALIPTSPQAATTSWFRGNAKSAPTRSPAPRAIWPLRLWLGSASMADGVVGKVGFEPTRLLDTCS